MLQIFRFRLGSGYSVITVRHWCWEHVVPFSLRRAAVLPLKFQQISRKGQYEILAPSIFMMEYVEAFLWDADSGGIWLLCVSWLLAELLKLPPWCRHHLMYFSQTSLSCRCCIAILYIAVLYCAESLGGHYVYLICLPPRLMPSGVCAVLSLLFLRMICLINNWQQRWGCRTGYFLNLRKFLFPLVEVNIAVQYHFPVGKYLNGDCVCTKLLSCKLISTLPSSLTALSRLYPGLKTAVAPERSGEMISQLLTDLLPSLEAALGGTWIDDNLRVFGIPANWNQSKRLTQVSGLTLVRTRGVSWLLWTLLPNPTTSHSSAEVAWCNNTLEK